MTLKAVAIAIVGGALAPFAAAAATTCAYTGWAGDGCATATGAFLVAPYYKSADFATLAMQSGQKWAHGRHPWKWNAPGIDYGIGPPAGLALADPATARLPAGCMFRPNGGPAHGPELHCGRGAVNPVLSGIDFSLHGCTVFQADANVVGGVTLRNSRFVNGPNCNVRFGYLIKMMGGAVGLTLENDLIDEVYPRYDQPFVGTVVVNTTGQAPLTVRYTAILNAGQRPINGTVGGPISMEHNVFMGFVLGSYANTGEHGEILELGNPDDGAVYPSVVYRNNVVVIPASTAMTVTAPFYPNGLNGKHHVINRFVADHNVIVTNLAGGVSASTASEVEGTVEGAVMTVKPGHRGGLSPGVTIVGLGAHGRATIVKQLDREHFLLSGAPAQGAFAGGKTVRATTGVAIAQMSYAAGYRSVAITNNYVDPTGAFSCIQNVGTVIDKLDISGNVSLVTGGPIEGMGYKAAGATCPPLF